MNRTTITLPSNLVETLRKLEGVKTKAAAVRQAVEAAVKRYQQLRWMQQNQGRRLLNSETADWRHQIERR